MSFVISALTSHYGIVAGDTQLNDDMGKMNLTAMKVFPIKDNMVIGFTGDYLEGVNAIQQFANGNIVKNFNDTVKELSNALFIRCKKGNAIIIKWANDRFVYALLNGERMWEYQIHVVINTDIKLLMPPDIDLLFCRSFFNTNEDLKQQTINCIRAVSKKSDSVNNKIYGIEIINGVMKSFTDGISINDIDFKHNINI